jgi:large repetitive protein
VPNAAITGDVTIENRANINAQAGAGLYAFNYGSGNTSVTFGAGQYSITAVNGGATGTGTGLTQYGIFAFNYGAGSSTVNTGWGTTITSGSTGINAGNQATTIASGSGSTVSVYSQGFISSGTNVNNGGSAQSAIQAGYNPGGNGAFSSAVYGDVIVNVASDGNPFNNPNPTLLAAAGAGIVAYNYGVGNITVSVGGGVSIQALTAASSSTSGNAPYGIAATNRGSGNILVVTSAGSSINSGSNGINAVNDANPTAGSDLANLFAANVAAGRPAVVAVTAAGTITSGSLLTNSGNTSSGIAAGFFAPVGGVGHANQYVSGNVFINNAAVINAAGFGLQGYNFGYGNITINNASGANITAGSNGIYAHADGGFTDPITGSALSRDIAITVYANTTITAGTASSTAYGILALSTNAGNISVVTSAGDTIDSHLGGSGINAVNQATSIDQSFNSSVVVTNVAAIHSGIGLTGFNNQPAGILASYIGQATSPGTANLANPNVYGEVIVNNSGNITADGGDGIRATNYGVGDVYVNNFAGTIVALGGANPPNGTGVGIIAQNYGPGSVHVTTSASTSITSGSSGISATNKATTADPVNSPPFVPATTEIDVYASGTIHSGTTLTGSGDPPAGILAGYNPNNLDNPQTGVNVHGSVFIDSHATILAPAGTDGIRGVNYGDGDIKIVVESDSDVMGGRYGVAALGYNGGDLSITNSGSVIGTTAALDAVTTGAGTVTIDNIGYLGGIVIASTAAFTNEAGALWQFDGASTFSGISTLANAGTIETNGTSSIAGLAGLTNTGLIAVDSGVLTLSGPVTGGGQAILYDATLVLGGASDLNVRFADINPATGGLLTLQDPIHFTGTVTGFTFGDSIDLAGIALGSVSVTSQGGFLQINFAGGAVQLLGNYDPSGFVIGSDGSGGSVVSWNHAAPSIDTTQFTLVNNPDNSTTVMGLHVNDADAAANLVMTAVTAGAASGTTITPPASSGSLSAINSALSGVTYAPGATPPAIEKITLTVSDSWGASDTANFIFTPGSNNGSGGVTLQGTSGNDVIFSTGGPDVLIGGAGHDQFVFSPNVSSSVQDTIMDFSEGIDRIDLREFAGITAANIQSLIQGAQTAQASGLTGNDTLLTLDNANHTTVLLKNVVASSLQTSDFIVHA